MPDAADHADHRRHAGTVLWPSGPDALTDTTSCPACLAPLTAIVCPRCGLNLAHPAAAELARLSQVAADALSQRVEVIGRIRYETRHADSDRPSAAVPAASPAVEPEPAAPRPVPGTVAPAPRRSGVQVALLVAGVSLLSVFAIFFLVYAFINYGIVWRSLIIAAITVAAFASASLLRRRSLVASAEGLAVFALLLVYLDAYAVRVNDFFGLASTDAATYWGATMVLAGVGFIGWHRLSRVCSASIVGWAGLAPGAGLLAFGLSDAAEPATRVFLAVMAATIASLLHVLVPHAGFAGILERMLMLSTAAASVLVGFVVAWAVAPDSELGGLVACLGIALGGFAHAAAAALGQGATAGTRAFGLAFGSAGGVAAAAAVAFAAVRLPDDRAFAVMVPAVAAAAVTLLLEAGSRTAPAPLRRLLAWSAWGAAAIAALVTLFPLLRAASPILGGLPAAVGSPWSVAADAAVPADTDSGLGVAALAIVVALATLVWLVSGLVHARGAVILTGILAVVILAIGQLPSLGSALAGWMLVAVLCAAALRAPRVIALGGGYRAPLLASLAVSTTIAFTMGWWSIDTWATTAAATIAILLACRRLTAGSSARAALLSAALMVFLGGVAAASRHVTWLDDVAERAVDVANAALLAGIAAAVTLALCAVGRPRDLSTSDRRSVFWVSGTAAALAALLSFTALTDWLREPHTGLLLPPFVASAGTAAVLVTGMLLWAALPANSALRPERIAASVALAPGVLWLIDSFARALRLDGFAQSVVPITAALVTAAGALALSLTRPSATPRWARELGIGIVGVPAVLSAVSSGAASAWLVLLLAGVTALFLAIAPDGLSSSASPRRHLGWLALTLATSGLWWRLSGEQADAVEAYVLPLAGALLLISYLIHRAAARAGGTSAASPLVALGGLLVGVLPLASDSLTRDGIRPLVVFAVSAALLLAGSAVMRPVALRPYLDAVALSSAVGTLVVAAGRASLSTPRTLERDGWLAALILVLIVAAFAQARPRGDAADRWRRIAGFALGAIALTALLLVQLPAFRDPTLGSMRALAVVTLLSALHVIAFSIGSAPFTRAMSWLAISYAAIAALVASSMDALHPLELGTLPVAIALLASGSIRMTENADARSWPWLGPGVAALLLPSLVATIDDPELWRLVGLGVAAVSVLIVGAVRRLQAPFLLGLVVALVHGFRTFAPQVRAVYESQEWWVWGGIAGVVLVLLAIRYEQRIQNLKDAVGRIAALR